MIEMKSLHDKLSTQAPFALTGESSRKKETEPQRFVQVSKEVLSFAAYYIGIIENERDVWKQKHDIAQIEKGQMQESLRHLAKQHQKLEKSANSAIRKDSFLEERPAQVQDEEEKSEDEDEFFDAIESGPSFVLPADAPRPAVQKRPSQSGFVRRTQIPANGPSKRPGIWAVLSNNIGKELSKISIPILFNEPLSALQKWAEDVEYANLLDYAAKCTDPMERLAYVATFHCSHYSDTMHRIYKPFNPILGESYECVRDEIGEGVKFVAEQVSHHPPVSACYMQGNTGWEYYTTLDVKNAFKGKDMEIYPQGISHVRFANGEHITYRRVTTCARNIIVGKIWVDNYGKSTFVNHTTGAHCVLEFKPYSYLKGVVAEVSGRVVDKDGKEHYILKGKWDEGMTIQPSDLSRPAQLIWKRDPLPEIASKQYEFTSLAITLNEFEPGAEHILPPTDSRFRGDLRRYEEGKIEESQAEKERLEEKQRASRRLREASGQEHRPFFFDLKYDLDVNQEIWTFNHSYWRRREKGDWEGLPDLYS